MKTPQIIAENINLSLDYFSGAADLLLGRYANNGALALTARDHEEGDPIATLSINLKKLPAPGCCWIKPWSENLGLEDWLQDHPELGKFTGRAAIAGFGMALEFQIEPTLLAKVERFL